MLRESQGSGYNSWAEGTCMAAKKCYPNSSRWEDHILPQGTKRDSASQIVPPRYLPILVVNSLFHSPKFLTARMGETTTADPMKAFDGQLETFWADIAGDRAWLGLDFSSQVGKTGRYFGSI